ncbi:MAG: lipopolysaccharide biosynthesis protein [Pseudanabaena sp.]|nr:MAG: lipopolysaccharide biosynthesis protein [Pseudanabaena sp.]
MQIYESPLSFYKLNKIIKRQWVPIAIVFFTVVSVGVIVTFTQKSSYSAEGKLLFRRSSTTPSLTGLGEKVGDLSSLRDQSSPVDTELEIIRSEPLLNRTITTLDLRDSKGNVLSLKDFAKRFKITAIKGTDIIQLNYEDPDPKVAAAVINTLMGIYLEENINNYRSVTSKARKFVEEQIPAAEETVKKAELELRRFRDQNQVISLEDEQRDSVKFLLDMQNQFNIVQSQLSDTESQLKLIQNQLGLDPDRAIAITAANQSKGVQDLLTEKQTLEAQLANESTRFQASHPTIQNLRSKIAGLDSLLSQRIAAVNQRGSESTSNTPQIGTLQQDLTSQIIQLKAKRTGLIGQLESLRNSQEQKIKRVDTLPRLEQKQRQLVRYLDVAQATYTQLLKKKDELKVAEAQSTGNAQIVAPAIVAQEPIERSKFIVIVASSILGGLLAIAVGYILDSADRSLRTTEDIMQVYKFPILGEIPLKENLQVIQIAVGKSLPKSNTKLSEQDQNSLMRELSQILGLNLKVLNIKQSIKIITVTSVEDGEGKSTVASYLAASLAQLGKKVVLVDANFHSPSQHRLWYHVGLSDVLLKSVDLDLAVVESIPNLSVLSSGTLSPSHPLAILDTSKMESIIHNLSSRYDYVIIDTPAIRSNPDALFLNKFSDGMLLVVRPNVSTLDSVDYLKEILAQSGQTMFAQVING